MVPLAARPNSLPTTVTLALRSGAGRQWRGWLEASGHRVEVMTLERVVDGPLPSDVVCLDLAVDEASGLATLKRLLDAHPDLPVVVCAARGGVDAAMRAGAFECVAAPLHPSLLLHAVERATEVRRLREKVRRLETQLGGVRAMRNLVGQSPPMEELRRQVSRALSSDAPVAIFGESGTGKELVARLIHEHGHRADGPFVAVHCAAIPGSLQESEIFGHEDRGPDGVAHLGRLQRARGGILFLDEVAELDHGAQAALLRTLKDEDVDVRIVCATQRNLEAEVAKGRFRRDLHHQLAARPVSVPPLRERAADIPALVRHFVERLAPGEGLRPMPVDIVTLDALMQHTWPGNVRELRNTVHRALLLCDGKRLALSHFPRAIRERAPATALQDSAGTRLPLVPLRELEYMAIRRALEETDGNVSEAARLLGIGRATVYRRLAEMEVRPATA